VAFKIKDVKIEAMLGEMMKEYEKNGQRSNDIKLNNPVFHRFPIILYQ
jgi:hypothetical protein